MAQFGKVNPTTIHAMTIVFLCLNAYVCWKSDDDVDDDNAVKPMLRVRIC